MRPELVEPATNLLRRAESNGISAGPSDYFTGQTYIALSGLYGTWANGGNTSHESLTVANTGLASVLQELLDKDMIEYVVGREIIASLTLKMIIHRMKDPYHVALPSPPGTRTRTWKDRDGQSYPPCNVILTTKDNELMPAVIRPTEAFIRPPDLAGFFRLGLGGYLFGKGQHLSAVRSAPRSPDWGDSAIEQSHTAAIEAAAKWLIAGSKGSQLDSTPSHFLNRVGRGMLGLIEAKPRRSVPLQGFVETS